MVHSQLMGPLFEFGLWVLGRRRRYRIDGDSMRPTLAAGDQVLVDPGAYRERPPVPGEVVVARHPYRRDLEVVKRVSRTLPDGSVRLRGDNPEESTDSRDYGAVPLALVRGRVMMRLPTGSISSPWPPLPSRP